MSPHSRIESLPAELLSGILTRCSRVDLISLAQTHSRLRAMCRKELANYIFTIKITSKNLKSWLAYFGKENTLLTWGARSLDITIAVSAPTIHPDEIRILPLPSNLRKLSLKVDIMPSQDVSSETLLLLPLLRPLPERCPHLEELSIRTYSSYRSNEFDKCIRRLTHLRKLYFQVWNMPNIPKRLSLLPASLTDLCLRTNDIQTQEKVTTTVPWVGGIRKLELMIVTPQGIANVLMILSRGGATHLIELSLKEARRHADPATMISLRKALTVGLREFSLLQPPLRTLGLTKPSAWSDFLHLPLLHTAVASTLTQLYLHWMDSCLFPSHLPWPRLQSLKLSMIPKIGYQGSLIEPIFPVLTAITICVVGKIQTPEDLFPALETIKWGTTPKPEQVASLVRHDIKRIDMSAYYDDDLCKPLWEAMGGYTVGLIGLKGRLSDQIERPVNNGERIFPEFPNIREFTIKWEDDLEGP